MHENHVIPSFSYAFNGRSSAWKHRNGSKDEIHRTAAYYFRYCFNSKWIPAKFMPEKWCRVAPLTETRDVMTPFVNRIDLHDLF